MKKRILVIRGGAIGDFILTIPVFRALKAQFPDNEIHVLGYPHIASLAMLTGDVSEVHPIEARQMAGFFARNGELDKSLQGFFDSFGLIISYLFDPDRIFHDNVGRATGAQFIQGSHRPDEQQGIHATEVFLRALESLAIFSPDSRPRLDPERLQLSSAITAVESRATIALHPGSGSPNKNWRVENWIALIQNLIAETDYRLMLVGGEADRDRHATLKPLIPSDRLIEAFGYPLNELAAMLAGCSGFIGHDSGISHLAAAAGLQGIVIWPSTNPAIWEPKSERFHRLHAPEGINAIPPSRVFGEALKLFPPVNADSDSNSDSDQTQS